MKRIKKILITVCALVMALGTSIVSSAAAPTTVSVARVKAFTVTQDGKKALKKVTVYSNGADKNAKITVRYTYDDVTVKSKEGDVVKSTVAPAEVRVTSANRGIVNVASTLKNVEVKPNESKAKTTTKNGVVTTTIPVTVEGELSYTPVVKGSTKITIEENTSQKGSMKRLWNCTGEHDRAPNKPVDDRKMGYMIVANSCYLKRKNHIYHYSDTLYYLAYICKHMCLWWQRRSRQRFLGAVQGFIKVVIKKESL